MKAVCVQTKLLVLHDIGELVPNWPTLSSNIQFYIVVEVHPFFFQVFYPFKFHHFR